MILSRSKLLLCAFALVALYGPSTAQASQWSFANGTESIPFLEASFELEAATPWILHSRIAGIEVLFSCSSLAAINGYLKEGGTIGKGFKVKLSQCVTKLNGVTSRPCEPNFGTAPGVVITNPLHGELKGETIWVVPDSGTTYGQVEMSEECAIGEKVPVIGSELTFTDAEGALESLLVKHLLNVSGRLWMISETFEHQAFILGTRWAYLGGPHTGLKWSGS